MTNDDTTNTHRDSLPIEDDSVFAGEGVGGDHQGTDDLHDNTRLVDAHLEDARASIGEAQRALVEYLDAVAARQDDDPNSMPDFDNPKLVMIWNAMDAVRQAISHSADRRTGETAKPRALVIGSGDRAAPATFLGWRYHEIAWPIAKEIHLAMFNDRAVLAEYADKALYLWPARDDGLVAGSFTYPSALGPDAAVEVSLEGLLRVNPDHADLDIIAYSISEEIHSALEELEREGQADPGEGDT